MKESIQKWINTILLGVLTVLLSVGTSVLIQVGTKVNDKLDALMIQTTINSERILGHNSEAELWKNRIVDLETGQAVATKDRITKTEALKAIEDLREWVEKYYERK